MNTDNSYSDTPKSTLPHHSQGEPESSPESALVYESGSLLKGLHEILIQHNGETYRLRLTKNNKLILHK